MKIDVKPSFEEFKAKAKKGNLIPLYVDIIADQITPVSLLNARWKKSPHCFLLESVEGEKPWAAILLSVLIRSWSFSKKAGKRLFKPKKGVRYPSISRDALSVIKEILSKRRAVVDKNLPAFFWRGGWILLV